MRSLLRRYPATIVLSIAVTVGFALQWFLPLEELLQRDAEAIGDGQWWRVFTSVLVQGSGWGQYVFNTLGLLVIGAAVEKTRGSTQWVVAAVVAQIGASLCARWWWPDVPRLGQLARRGGPRRDADRHAIHSADILGRGGGRLPDLLRVVSGRPRAGGARRRCGGGVGARRGRRIDAGFALPLRHVGAHREALLLVVGASVVLVFARDQHGVAVLAGLACRARGRAPTAAAAGTRAVVAVCGRSPAMSAGS